MKLFLAILWLSAALACRAAEIVAWDVPLSTYTNVVPGSGATSRLSTPPEKSPFFHEGDELWDLGKLPTTPTQSFGNGHLDLKPVRLETTPPLEWVVWNATTDRLVTKCDWNGIWQLVHLMKTDELPAQCRMKLEIFASPADGSVPSADAHPAASVTSILREQVDAEVASPSVSLIFRASASWSEPRVGGTMKIELDSTIKGEPTLKLKTSLSFGSGKPAWIARDFDGTKGTDIRLTCTTELFDGTPRDEAIMIQCKLMAKPLSARTEVPWYQSMPDGFKFMSFHVDPRIMIYPDTSGETDSPTRDPFTEPPPPVPAPRVFAETTVPEALREWISGPQWDMREWLEKVGINVAAKNHAGFDLPSRTIYFLSDQDLELEKFGQLFVGGCCITDPSSVTLDFQGTAISKLICLSGRTARLERVLGTNESIRMIEVEPTVSATGDIADVRLKWNEGSRSGTSFQRLESSFVLKNGIPLDMSVGTDEGKPLRIVGRISEISQ